MKQTKWTDVEMTAPAVIGLLFGVVGTVTFGPIGGVVALVLGMAPLAAYRIATRA